MIDKHRAQRDAAKLAAEAKADEAAARAGSHAPADTLEDTLIAPEIEADKPKRQKFAGLNGLRIKR